MANYYTFRVLIDYENDVFRDIEIDAEAPFSVLHETIQKAFNFDGSQISSFYLSNNEWDKGEEIGMIEPEPNANGTESYTMYDTKIKELVVEPNQKLLYVSDFFLMWCFFVELVKITDATSCAELPAIVLSFGDAPEQYDKMPDLGLEEEPEEEGEGDIFDGFDDFDDYQ